MMMMIIIINNTVAVFQKQRESRQAPVPMLMLGSFVLMFHWLKQVTRPSLDSMWEELHKVKNTVRHVSLGQLL